MSDPTRHDPPASASLPNATRLGAVHLRVSDLERSLAWYREVLGLRLIDREEGAGRARLGTGSGVEPLVVLEGDPGVNPVPRHGRLGLYHFAILMPDRIDLGAFIGHLSARREPVGAADHLVSEALYLHDPDGLGVEVYVDRPREEWRRRRHAGRDEIAMASDPLDIDGLLSAAAGRQWLGMPAGTRIGHMHLHVGDLAAAEAFYGDALGLDVVTRSYPGALFLSAGGYHHHLGLNTWARGAPPAGESDARLDSWEIVLPTADAVAAARARLEAAGFVGARFSETPPTETAGLAAEAGTAVAATTGSELPAAFRDPWGTLLRLRAERP